MAQWSDTDFAQERCTVNWKDVRCKVLVVVDSEFQQVQIELDFVGKAVDLGRIAVG
jgi:hypothetical protein